MLLSLHNPVARAARALAGRYTVRERGDRLNFEPRAHRYTGLARLDAAWPVDGTCWSYGARTYVRTLFLRKKVYCQVMRLPNKWKFSVTTIDVSQK